MLSHAGDEISEGELRFLDTPPQQIPHHQSKHVTITAASLVTGWVLDRQCHYHLDRVPAMEIVFGAGRVRDLKVSRYGDIARVWVEGDSVQMENVGADAFICIESENRILKRDSKRPDEYVLLSGPYMRRFLDGFFPMKVDLVIDYPEELLHLKLVAPRSLSPYVTTTPGHVKVNTFFEGRLLIGIVFSHK